MVMPVLRGARSVGKMPRGKAGARAFAAVLAAAGVLTACIELTKENLVAQPPAPVSGNASLAPLRTINGGFLGGPSPLTGVPVRPSVGAFVRLVAPGAVAVRGNDLLIVDSGAGRIYRYDVALNALITLAGAPATPQTRVAIGPDLSAYVLDPTARQVLRFARDGRLLQTFRPDVLFTPADFALGADNVSLQFIDRTTLQLVQMTQVGASVLPLRPQRADGSPAGVPASIAIGRAGTYLLDATAGVVDLVDRDGRVVRTFGKGDLTLPGSLAVDRFERVYVTEPAARTIRIFRDGVVVQTMSPVDLRLASVGSVASSDNVLAVSDPESGQVGLYQLRAEPGR